MDYSNIDYTKGGTASGVGRAIAVDGAGVARLGEEAGPARTGVVSWDSVPLQRVSWLWKDYLLAGKLNLLVGAPGSGKTTLALSLAAAVSSAGAWPDGSPARRGDVLVCAAGKGVKELMMPRFGACGGDSGRAFWLEPERAVNEPADFNPFRDGLALGNAMYDTARRWKLLIVDDLPAIIPGGDPNNLRCGLEHLAGLASGTGCAILGIAAFSQTPRRRDNLERLLGVVGPGAEVPMVLACARREAASGGGVLVRVRSRFGPDSGGFEYRMEEGEAPGGFASTRVAWGAAQSAAARRVLADADEDAATLADRGALADAMSFLQSLLADGPMRVRELRKSADGAGHAWRTMVRAKAVLGARAFKEDGSWHWNLGTAGVPKGSES